MGGEGFEIGQEGGDGGAVDLGAVGVGDEDADDVTGLAVAGAAGEGWGDADLAGARGGVDGGGELFLGPGQLRAQAGDRFILGGEAEGGGTHRGDGVFDRGWRGFSG